MALRITTASLAPEQPAEPAPGAQTDEALAALSARAHAALIERRFDAYRDCFADASAIEDPSRRYYARKLLIEQGFATCPRVPAARQQEILLATATAAIDVLDPDPAEPVLLNYAGVALYELWSLDAAQSLFAAAQRLDPTLSDVRSNLAECKRRKRAGGRSRRPLRGVSPGLVRRARALAERAHPASGMRLSLCMIVRDEEEMLPRSLGAVASAVDEIVIVDTGSQDRTIEIARLFGARVIEREWTGSFSDARNVSFEAATGDWLLYLDADEVLVEGDAERLRALTGQSWRECFYLVETNFTGQEGSGGAVSFSALRMFRNRPGYRFSGRLHEQIGQHMPAYVPERIHYSNVRVEHYGYLGVVRDSKEKSRRNIELLLAQQTESAPHPFMHFNLGSEYYAAGDVPAALRELEQSWAMVSETGPDRYLFTAILIERLTKARIACGRPAEAIDLAAAGLALYPGYTDLVYQQGNASLALGRFEDAAAYFEACIEMGDAPAPYTALVGCGTYLPRIALAEIRMRDGDVEGALEPLRWCAQHHARFFGLILPYATALLRAGTSAEEVIATIEGCVPSVTPIVRFMLGTALFESGAAQAAEGQFRSVLESQPHSGQARIALSEVLLYQRRYREAAHAAAAIDPGSPASALAARSELFGTILAGDLAGARGGLQRARRAGTPAGELALFASWLGYREGAADPPRVPAESVSLLASMLESLLRVQDFESFETLLPVLERTELPPRERRELLAQVYLRRGFLRSAAREWMAVAGERPDVRAMVGLAHVALGNAQPGPARTFAAQALVLDPDCAEAARILEAVRMPEVAAAVR
ncbi:MAG: glycosyltransferase [Solirubrobacteraceae bacterium]